MSDLLNRASYAQRYLVNLGLTPQAAAGVVGNLMQESGLNPGASGDQGTAFGIAQWRGPRAQARQAFASQNGMPLGSVDTDLRFLNSELRNSYARVFQDIMKARTPEEAAGIFALGYERPKGSETGVPQNVHGWQNRAHWANVAAGTPDTPVSASPVAQAAIPSPTQQVSMDPGSAIPSFSMPEFPQAPTTAGPAVGRGKPAQQTIANLLRGLGANLVLGGDMM